MKNQSGKKRRNLTFRAVHVALALVLALGATSIFPEKVRVKASELMPEAEELAIFGTPGGIDAELRLWLKADSESVTEDEGNVTEWRDSS